MSVFYVKKKGKPKMSKNNFNQSITTADTDIVKQLQEIYKKLGIPLNGMSKELYCHSEASCAAI